MLRLVLGVIGGLVAWLVVWLIGEKILSAIFPDAFGAPQRAFQEALTGGGEFTADNRMLLIHIVLGLIVSLLSGSLAALIANENVRAPLFVGFLLLAMGIAKAVMSWQYVPVWYHVIFTGLLIPMAIIGGKLISTS